MAEVIVIGAGIAGLATAALLARDGHDVTVLEQHDRPGGRAGLIESEGFRFDTGPSWYLMPSVYEHFAALLGTSVDELLELSVLDPGYELWRATAGDDASGVDRWAIPLGADAVTAEAELRQPGDGQALRTYLDSAADALRLSLDSFLYNPFASLRSLLTPTVLREAPRLTRWLSEDLASFSERSVRGEALRQVLQYPGIFLGVDPRRAPAIYHLMSHVDLVEGVAYPKGGFTSVVEALTAQAEAQGARIVYGARVERIVAQHVRGHRKPRVRGVEWVDRDGASHRTGAEVVVSAADLHHTETRLLPEDQRSYPERAWRRSEPGPSAVLVMLGVRGRIPELPHHALLLTRDWERELDAVFGAASTPEVTSLYVCTPSRTDDTVAPDGDENLFILVPVSGEIELGHGTGGPGWEREDDPRVRAIADAAVRQLERWSGVDDLGERVVVRHTIGPADFGTDYNSWADGMLGPAHTLRQSALFRRGPRSRRVEGLLYAGATATPGVGVPMCLISAELILKELRGDASPGPIPAEEYPRGRA